MKQLDFLLSFCREMIPGQGEDSFCHSFREEAGLLAVFDGCGGAGARTHEYYTGRTEAYMASRLCAGAFYDTFRAASAPVAPQLLGDAALARLKTYSPPADPDGLSLMGSMVRTLPTTAAAALVRQEGERLAVTAAWAGDSRVYVLDAHGLAQLTVDDTSVPDPMDNLYDDGVLRNVFCADRAVKLHSETQMLSLPAIVLTATDGCFGYLSSPMEFEGLLLRTLMDAENPAQWEQALAAAIGSVAGDDHCLCLAAFGYGSFDALKESLQSRYSWLQKCFLQPLSALPVEDRASRTALWLQYRDAYFRYRKEWRANE